VATAERSQSSRTAPTPARWPSPEVAQRFAKLSLHDQAVVDAVTLSSGFGTLSEPHRQQLVKVLTGCANQLSERARLFADALTTSAEFRTASAEEQGAQLESFVNEPPYLPDAYISPEIDAALKESRAVRGPGRPVQRAFRNGVAEGMDYEVRIGEQSIAVFFETEHDAALQHHTIEDVMTSLAALPAECRARLKFVQVNGFANPDDASWAKEFGLDAFRSYMTADVALATIDVYPTEWVADPAVMACTLIHEVGHFVSAEKMGPLGDERWKGWQDAMASDQFVVSEYAQQSPDEDFAETIIAYQLARNTPAAAELRDLMPGRFQLLDTLLKQPASLVWE
jgi:hypothetical protein